MDLIVQNLNWYTIDPIFYSSQDVQVAFLMMIFLMLYTRRVFIDEIFPQTDIVQGQNTIIPYFGFKSYFPSERGPYNMDPKRNRWCIR